MSCLIYQKSIDNHGQLEDINKGIIICPSISSFFTQPHTTKDRLSLQLIQSDNHHQSNIKYIPFIHPRNKEIHITGLRFDALDLRNKVWRQLCKPARTSQALVWIKCFWPVKYNAFYLFVEVTHKNNHSNNYLTPHAHLIQININRFIMEHTPIVQNVVSFAKMQIEEDIDLKLIAQKVEGSRFNKKRFPAVIMRKTKPKSTVLIFKSGRMIIIGSANQIDAESVAVKAAKDITKALNIFKLKVTQFRVTNIVANADLGSKIDIGRLCEQRNVIRNQNFPGVVYKQLNHVKSALIFASGKVVFTGAKSKDSIDNAYKQLKRKMQKFKKINY